MSAVMVTLTLSFFIGFLSNCIYGLLPSISHSSSNADFVRHPIIKMADKMAAANVRCHGHSNFVFFYRISFKLHIWIASINFSFKFEYGFCPTSDSQDG